MNSDYDVAIIGGGIVGLATAVALTRETDATVVVLEAEQRLAQHQTGHNSGVLHSGLYYRPGSLKARLCVDGRNEMIAFCQARDIAHRICGKVVVATNDREAARLDDLVQRGKANGLHCVRRLSSSDLRDREPYVRATAAIEVSDTGIVDFANVAHALAVELTHHGGTLLTATPARSIHAASGSFRISGVRDVQARVLVNCAGVNADRIASMCNVNTGVRIIPFRGEYYRLTPAQSHLVQALVYPVPDPALPFLGVHFTRSLDGTVEVGPNAVLALHRHGYRWRNISLRDMLHTGSYSGFWRLASRHGASAVGEIARSLSRHAFVRAARQIVPSLHANDMQPGRSGVRAQAVDRAGRLVDDFHIVQGEGMVHVLNAPSPAATASLPIGRHIASLVVKHLPARTTAAVSI